MTGMTHRLDRGAYDELVTVCMECAATDPELTAMPHATYLGVSRGEHRIAACEHPNHGKAVPSTENTNAE